MAVGEGSCNGTVAARTASWPMWQPALLQEVCPKNVLLVASSTPQASAAPAHGGENRTMAETVGDFVGAA